MKYALGDLLRVRNFRVDAAMRQVVAARQHLLLCQKQRSTKQQELNEFIRHRLAREKALYDEILGKSIKLSTLEEIKDKIRLLRMEQTAFEQQLLDAQRSVDAANEALRDAQNQHRRAVRAEEKLKQHQQIWRFDATRLQGLKEDLEIEDIPFRPRTNP